MAAFMNILKAILSSIVFCLLLIVFSSPISSCTKTTVQHDTTIKVVNDTTILTVIDTIFDLRTGLIAYYNFINGNLNDSSGNGNTITFNNCVATKDRGASAVPQAACAAGAQHWRESVAAFRSLNADDPEGG